MLGARLHLLVICVLIASACPAGVSARAGEPAEQPSALTPSAGNSPAALPHEFGPDAGRFFSVDQHGTLHLAYGGGQLYYATNAGAGWQYEVADARRGAGGWAALALMPDATPLIAYVDAPRAVIRLAHRTAGGWATETVTSTTSVQDLALAVDSGGQPHLAFVSGSTLTYMHRTSEGWSQHAIPGVWAERHGDFLALDRSDRPHLAYLSDFNKVTHEWLSDAGWQTETAVILYKPNMYQHYEIWGLSLAMNSHGVAGLAYAWTLVTYGGADQFGSDFKYLAGGQPSATAGSRSGPHVASSARRPAAPAFTYPYRPSLTFGPDDTPRVADASGVYAFWTADGPVGEQYRGFEAEETCALAVEPNGSPQIACVGSALRLYRRSEPGWSAVTLDENVSFGARLWLPGVFRW